MRHWPAAALEGMAYGVVALDLFAIKRSLGGPEAYVPLFIALCQIPWILTPAVGTLLAASDPQRLWRRLAVGTYVPVILIAVVFVAPTGEPGHGTGNLMLFLVLLFVHFGTAIASVPHVGAMLRTNYEPAVRGRMFGFATAVRLFGAALTAKLAGHLLDRDPRWLRVVFPVAGVMGLCGYLLYARIRWRHQRHVRVYRALADRPLAAMRAAWREAFHILKEDRAFRTYELGFMLYGCGFLVSIGLLVLYAEDVLGLSYGEFTSAQFLAFPIAQILGAAVLGRLSDNIGIVRMTAISFAMLGSFFAVMPLVGSVGGLIAAYALWGFSMSGVLLGWSLGPLHFASEGRAHMYGAIHFSLVGVRSLFAPLLGYLVKRQFSYTAAFALSAVLMGLAMITVWRLGRASRQRLS